jgi:hypothetical protein
MHYTGLHDDVGTLFVAYMLGFVTASEAKQSPSLQEDCFDAFGVSQ